MGFFSRRKPSSNPAPARRDAASGDDTEIPDTEVPCGGLGGLVGVVAVGLKTTLPSGKAPGVAKTNRLLTFVSAPLMTSPLE